jgi:hypothetical protein
MHARWVLLASEWQHPLAQSELDTHIAAHVFDVVRQTASERHGAALLHACPGLPHALQARSPLASGQQHPLAQSESDTHIAAHVFVAQTAPEQHGAAPPHACPAVPHAGAPPAPPPVFTQTLLRHERPALHVPFG